MSNATHGNSSEQMATTFRVYDTLPPPVRELVRNSIADWATSWIAKDLKRGVDILPTLMSGDVDYVRRAAKKDWGRQAPDYIAAQRPRRVRDWFDKPPRSRL